MLDRSGRHPRSVWQLGIHPHHRQRAGPPGLDAQARSQEGDRRGLGDRRPQPLGPADRPRGPERVG
eukprot:705495-Lingulodinium_polyedra.AAC.1